MFREVHEVQPGDDALHGGLGRQQDHGVVRWQKGRQ
jgi:hypothetical protein